MKKLYSMEWIDKSRTKESFYAESLAQAKKIAAFKAKSRGITEYYVFAE